MLLNLGIIMTHCGAEGPHLLSAISPNLKVAYNAFIVGISTLTSYSFLGRADVEDEVLAGRFGEEWRAWANDVPKFVPRLRC
jgi:protein-S-isoprenylcysteine O-methyltransferase Ste14